MKSLSSASFPASGPDKAAYLAMQRRFYDDQILSVEDARRFVHPHYERAQGEAAATQGHLLLDFLLRTYTIEPRDHVGDVLRRAATLPDNCRALDFGCGIGRLMVPLVEAGLHVDGVDISARMLDLAQRDAKLAGCRFFLGHGNDCGGAPDGAYDLVYSRLCLQHICSRTIRRELLAAFARALRPGGVLLVQMHFYPQHRATTVPAPHAPWSADRFEATGTNSEADVWPTPDELHLVYDDFARCFEDLRLQFVNFPAEAELFTEFYGTRFSHLIVSGATRGTLGARLYASSEPL